jgi:hypothetical protein
MITGKASTKFANDGTDHPDGFSSINPRQKPLGLI